MLNICLEIKVNLTYSSSEPAETCCQWVLIYLDKCLNAQQGLSDFLPLRGVVDSPAHLRTRSSHYF